MRCFGENAFVLWKTNPWVKVTTVVQESHYSLQIVACADCHQRFARVYADFEDAMHEDLFPVSPEVAADLVADGANISTTDLEAIGSQRRLQFDRFSDSREIIRWTTGRLMIWR
jgi:hypothetical protein